MQKSKLQKNGPKSIPLHFAIFLLITRRCYRRCRRPKQMSRKAVLPAVPQRTSVESTNCSTPPRIDPSKAKSRRAALAFSCNTVISHTRPYRIHEEGWASRGAIHAWVAIRIFFRLACRGIGHHPERDPLPSYVQDGRSLPQPNSLTH